MADRILVFRGGRIAAEFARGGVRPRGDPARRRACRAASQTPRCARNEPLPAPDTRGDRLEGRALARPGRRVPRARLVLALLVICLAVTLREPRFLKPSNLEQVALSATLVCIVALGEALVIIARQIDLSVGAIVAMSAFVSARLARGASRRLVYVVFLIGLRVGIALGAGNALLVAGLRIPAIVATLGTLAIYRGGVIVYAGGRQISATVLPDSYGAIAQIAHSRACRCWSGWRSLSPSSSAGSRASRRTGPQSLRARQQPGGRAFRRHQRAGGMSPSCSSCPACCAGWSACCGARASARSTR